VSNFFCMGRIEAALRNKLGLRNWTEEEVESAK
jgi:hypothetical protein